MADTTNDKIPDIRPAEEAVRTAPESGPVPAAEPIPAVTAAASVPVQPAAAAYPQGYRPQPFVCGRGEFLLWPLAFLMGYLFIRLILEHGTGLAAVLYIAGIYVTAAVYMKAAGLRPVRSVPCLAWTALTAALTASLLLLDGGTARQVIVLIAALFSAVIQLYTMLGCRRYGFEERAASDWADAALCAPFANLGAFWQTLGAMLKKGKSRTVLGVLIGFVIGLPLLIVLTLLLSSADGAFETFLDRYVAAWFEHLSGLSMLRIFGGIPVAMAAFGILYGCRLKRNIHRFGAEQDARRIPASAACGVLIPVTILYLVYLGTQAAYFFSAFSGLLPEGFTYAEYARRGFFELCAICAVNLGLIGLLTAFVRLGTGVLRFFRTFLSVFSLVLTGTALSKMLLYVRTYGMTPLRLQTTVFMLALGLVLVWVLLKTWILCFPVMRLIVVTAAAALLLFAFTDADAVSLRYNLEGMRTGRIEQNLDFTIYSATSAQKIGGFSYNELLYMSDGIEPILKTYHGSLVERLLSERAQDRAERPWLAWTVAEARAGK